MTDRRYYLRVLMTPLIPLIFIYVCFKRQKIYRYPLLPFIFLYITITAAIYFGVKYFFWVICGTFFWWEGELRFHSFKKLVPWGIDNLFYEKGHYPLCVKHHPPEEE